MGLLDESVMYEANVFAVIDAVDVTVVLLGGKEKEDPDEMGWVDVGGATVDCGDGDANVKELDGELNPANPPNFGDGGCSWFRY